MQERNFWRKKERKKVRKSERKRYYTLFNLYTISIFKIKKKRERERGRESE
jgi:hypothetical protein